MAKMPCVRQRLPDAPDCQPCASARLGRTRRQRRLGQALLGTLLRPQGRVPRPTSTADPTSCWIAVEEKP